jgi:hypothetical protein
MHLAVPPQEGRRLDDKQRLLPGARHACRRHHPPPVATSEPRSGNLPAKDDQLLAEQRALGHELDARPQGVASQTEELTTGIAAESAAMTWSATVTTRASHEGRCRRGILDAISEWTAAVNGPVGVRGAVRRVGGVRRRYRRRRSGGRDVDRPQIPYGSRP